MSQPSNGSGFDAYATGYDAALGRGLSVSGEAKAYFARGRVDWLRTCLRQQYEQPQQVLDFGCGTGTASPFLLQVLGAKTLVGIDVSAESLAIAQATHGSARVQFVHLDQYKPNNNIDLVFSNGVFHHIPPSERPNAMRLVYHSLRPGGLFALWENNPWNPGTRLVMRRIPFDRDAITLSPPTARRLAEEGGFEVLGISFLFIFPRLLNGFRRFETSLTRWPLGAQYQVLARKPRQ